MTTTTEERAELNRRLRPRRAWVAVGAGVGVYVLGVIMVNLALVPLLITVGLFRPVPFDFIASGLASRALVFHVVCLLLAGAWTSARIRRFKKSAALVLGVLVAVLLTTAGMVVVSAGRTMHESELLALPWWYILMWWVSVIVFPVLGAIVERRIALKYPEAFSGKRLAHAVAAVLLYIGLFWMTATALFLTLYPGALTAHDHVAGIVGMGSSVLVLLVAWFIVRRSVGMRRGLLLSPVSWLAVGLVALFVGMFLVRQRDAVSDEAEMRAFVEKFNHDHARPEGNAGADLYRKAGSIIEENEDLFPQSWSYPKLQEWRNGDHPQWSECLHANEEAIRAAIAAGRQETFNFPLGLAPEHGPAAWLQWTHDRPSMRTISLLLCARACQAAGELDYETARECCDAVHSMARAHASMPALDTIAGNNRRQRALTVGECLASDKRIPRAELLEVQRMLSAWRATPYPTKDYWRLHAELQERWFAHQTVLEMQLSGISSFGASVLCTETYLRRPVRRFWEHVLAAESEEGMYERVRELASGAGMKPREGSPLSFARIVERNLTSDYARNTLILLDQDAFVESRLNVLFAYVAAKRYLLDFGSLPTNWDALIPEYLREIPVDRFTGGPLKLKVSDGVLTVYSVGTDRLDDDGRGDFDGGLKRAEDICLVLRRDVQPG